MTHEFAQDPELLNIPDLRPDVAEVTLTEQHHVVIAEDAPALMDRETTIRELGLDATVCAGIKAGRKQFLILDLRQTPVNERGYKLLDPAHPGFDTDYLLIDETFALEGEASTGFKGIRYEGPAYIGTSDASNGRRFTYNEEDGVESRHFAVYESNHGALAVQNFSNEGSTRLHVAATRRFEDEAQAIAERDINDVPVSYEVGVAENGEAHGQDRKLTGDFLFGVFDGVSSDKRSGEAAELMAGVLERTAHHGESPLTFNDVDQAEAYLRHRLQAASTAAGKVLSGNTAAGTVAEITNVNIDGKEVPHVVWASAGDTRLYRYHQDDGLRMVTKDEGHENAISNWLGVAEFGDDAQPGVVRQTGHFAPKVGELMLLVSDGITGDYGDQVLSEEEIIEACDASIYGGAQSTADDLVRISRKHDDKTAVVVEFLDRENTELVQRGWQNVVSDPEVTDGSDSDPFLFMADY